MNFFINAAGDKPMYEQVKDGIKEAILSGELKAHDLMPSVRQLAARFLRGQRRLGLQLRFPYPRRNQCAPVPRTIGTYWPAGKLNGRKNARAPP